MEGFNEDGSRLGEILEGYFGLEYFLTNEKMDYMISVNWYEIEGKLTIPSKLSVQLNVASPL